ncbi:hypothetical protein V7183_17940, partial [Bacillus sp. JJ1127]
SISIQMKTTLLLPLAEQFEGGSGLYSIFEMAFSVGGIIAGFIAIYFLKKFKHKVIFITMMGTVHLAYGNQDFNFKKMSYGIRSAFYRQNLFHFCTFLGDLTK